MKDHYSKKELEQTNLPKFPDKGIYCENCKTWVPQFAELDELTASRMRMLIINGRGVMATKELQAKVGCSERWTKIWVLHKGTPTPVIPGPPCPYCGGELRTSLAKQCPHCFKQWHHE